MRIIKNLTLLFILIYTAGCEKTETFNNTEDVVGSSRVTRFPTFNMKGEKYVSIVKGGTFTDPGVTAKEGTADLQVTTSGTVNANSVGVYDITYSATNKDGFSSSITRTVAVLPSAEQAGANLSGQYQNVGSFSYVAVMQKLAPGFYLVDNVWGGGSAAVIASYVISVDGLNLILPLNTISPYGRVQGTGTFTPSTGRLVYSVSLLDYGLSNSVRTWQKL